MAIGLPEFLAERHLRLGWMLANPVLNPTETSVSPHGSPPRIQH